MSEKLWSGRFAKKPHKLAEEFTASISFDRRLGLYDIEGSLAHARMLGYCGIVPKKEAQTICRGLKQIRNELASDQFEFRVEDEDIHLNIERRLTEIIGPTAGKLHTARSRNDQVALATRLYLRDETQAVLKCLGTLEAAIVGLADQNIDVVMPGFTHLQHAQPVLTAHHLMAYYEMFARDEDRFSACLKSIDVMPLGSAALAGTTFPIDRKFVAEELGFSRISANSMDAVSDRDYQLEFLFASALCMTHLSRLCGELILWSSSEFGFVSIGEEFTTGSSIMPQKRNPDVAEIARGKAGRVYGNLLSLLTTLKGLPLTYHSDLQEDKPALFDTTDTVLASLRVIAAMLPTVKFHPDRTRAACDVGFMTATDLADALARKGVPFRDAHGIVGKLVAVAEKKGCRLEELSRNDLKSVTSKLASADLKALSPEAAIAARNLPGGTAKPQVRKAIRAAKKKLRSKKPAG